MRRIFCLIITVLAVWAFPVNVTAENLAVKHLKFAGKHIVTATDKRFGGLSGARVSADGRHIFAVIDEGRFANADLNWHEGGLSGVGEWKIGALLDESGAALKGKQDDAEAIEFEDADKNQFYVSFERFHRILLMRREGESLKQISEIAMPMFEPKSNDGVEALARLADGSLLVIAEMAPPAGESPQDGHTAAYIWNGSDWLPKAYKLSGGFNPTDAVRLPDDDVLVLERAFRLDGKFYARIRRIKAEDIAADVIEPELVAEISEECDYDNMEGLAAWQDAEGKIRLVVLSDDNFRLWQKTYVVAFEYEK